jgi:hypothetical protein
MTCSFCDYIGAGLLAIPMAASECRRISFRRSPRIFKHGLRSADPQFTQPFRRLALNVSKPATPNSLLPSLKTGRASTAEMDPQKETSESIPESEGWDPVPGSTGRQAADSLGEDEDVEGRSESAQLFEEGVSEAEHDQMRQASRADEESDEPEP